MSRHTREHETAIINAARAGKTGRQIALEHNVSPSTVSNVLRKVGFKPPTGRRPSCEVDRSFFDDVNEISAYWMGFFCADGDLGDKSGGAPQVGFSIATKDRAHLEKFKRAIKSTHSIVESINKTSFGYHDGEGGKASHFRVRSNEFAAALARHGLATYSPERLPGPALINNRDFWRGVVDGDGTVRWEGPYAHLLMCGHLPLMEAFSRYAAQYGVRANVRPDRNIFICSNQGEGAAKMIRILYENAIEFLNRKNATAQEIIDRYRGR